MLSLGDDIRIQRIMDKYTFEDSGNTIYEVLPRTPEDIEYAGVPKRYMNILLWGGLALLVLIVGWVVLLKRQVRSQTAELSQALKEKQTLMQEIHHRVKNNLSIIFGLLDLQIDTADNTEVQHILSDSKSRIRSMALIHDKLYQTESYSYVRLDNYLKELVEAIHGTFTNQKDSVNLKFQLEPTEMHVNKVVTCGLLINELV